MSPANPPPAAGGRLQDLSIWGFAFGYFACYAPYSAMTKLLSRGQFPGARPVGSFEMLPVTAMASLVGMLAFITAMGWWKHAGHRTVAGLRVPAPGRWTFLSGLCTAAIIPTTTLAYTFETSIVFMMLLMRGGLLLLAPIVDAVSGRRVQWVSWGALGLTLAALFVALGRAPSLAISALAVADVVIYLFSYFVRLRFMSRLAKSDDPGARTRYFVEEQATATPALLVVLGLVALVGPGDVAQQLRAGFTTFFGTPMLAPAIVIGLLSQGTGVFGGLVLLDRRENTFCVPVNRASSVLAGVLAGATLSAWWGLAPMPSSELAGAALIIAAIALLSVPTIVAKWRRPKPAGATP